MQQIIEDAKSEFLRAKGRLVKVLAATPDDRINWSPSETSRTPVQLVGHSASSIPGIQGWLAGGPFPFADMAQMDAVLREEEKSFTTRDHVSTLLEDGSTGYIAWLDSLTPEQVAADKETMMGTFPMAQAITWVADHIRSHVAQIEYVQTIYGDRS